MKHCKSGELAEALTCIDHNMLRAIDLKEFMNREWTRPDKYQAAPGIMKTVDR